MGDKSLKRPMSGYMLRLKDTRKTIKGKNVAEVSKKAGEMWKGLAADKNKVFADRALEAKKKYAAYVATGKGAAALKAYKEGIAKAKAPLLAKDDKLKAKKAAEKEKAKAVAKREKVKAAKEKAKAKAVAAKAAKAAKKEKVKASKAAKAKKAAEAKAAKKAAKAKKAAARKAKKVAKKAGAKKAKVAMKAKKHVMKVKKLIGAIPDVLNTPVTVLVGALSCIGIAF